MPNIVRFLWIRDLLRVQLGGSVSGKLSSWVYSHDKALLGLKILLLPSLLWLLVASVTHWRFRGFWSPPCELSALGYMQHGTLLPSEQTVQERGLEMEAVVPLQPHAGSGVPSFLPKAGGAKQRLTLVECEHVLTKMWMAGIFRGPLGGWLLKQSREYYTTRNNTLPLLQEEQIETV